MSINCQKRFLSKSWLVKLVCIITCASGMLVQYAHAGSKHRNSASANQTVSVSEESLLRTHVFEEPLVFTKATSPAEDAELLSAIASYRKQKNLDDFHLFTDFLDAHPESGWRVALFANLGLAYYHYGYFSKAINAWEQSWHEGKNVTDRQAKMLVDRAIGELLRMHARLGHSERLAELLKDVGDRPVSGAATEAVAGAKEGLWMMQNDPGVAYLCGPKALENLLLSSNYSESDIKFIDDFRSGPHGVTLAQVAELAKRAKLPFNLAYRSSGHLIPVPSLVHWKVNHFAAIVAKDGNRYHLKDPTFGTDLWVTRGALDTESSGYFLVPEKALPAGFRAVTLAEAGNVHGMGYTTNNDPGATSPDDDKGHDPCSGHGMCVANFHSMVLSLNLTDTPVGYAPPKGPPVFVTLTYNQREASQPANFNFFNVSPKWTVNWLSYIQDDPNTAGANVSRYVAGGGSLNYSGYSSTTGTFTPESKSTAVLTRLTYLGSVYYVRQLSDGTTELYSQTDGAISYPRRIFLTTKTDPSGNTVTLHYDSQMRLTSITDATGRDTTFSYDITGKPLLISAISDPFGRSAQLSYDASGRLQQITDVIGLTSQFTYDASSLINSMTTPYGTTQFSFGSNGTTRWLEITDPLGHTERAEFRHSAPGISSTESVVPTGIGYTNNYMQYRNTFFWDKSLYPQTHTDYTKARIKHWLHDTKTGYTAPVLESVKYPLENRIWYNYPGQSSSHINAGSSEKPSKIARVMANGTTQLTQIDYNNLGNRTEITDPMGRQTLYDYATNGVDVTAIRQLTATNTYTTIAQFTYNSLHEPLTYTDANGNTTAYTYNSAGQRLTETDPLGHVTTYNYDSMGYLISVVDANGSTVATFTYDAEGRVATRKDAGNNVLAYEYDNFDRVTKVTYPDGTYYQYQYDKLDLASVRDRMGLITEYTHDANRKLTSIEDPAGHVSQFAYYPNGNLKTTTNALNGASERTYDIQSRLTSITDPDGVQTVFGYDVSGNRISENSPDRGLTQYTYDAANSVIKKIDGRNVETDYGYDAFKRLAGVTYPASTSENATFAYDNVYSGKQRGGRLTGFSNDGSSGSIGYDAAGNVASQSETIGVNSYTTLYQYDDDNRLSKVTYSPSGHIVTYSRNALGQITKVEWQESSSSATQILVNNVSYLPFGPIQSMTFGNGAVTSLQYDNDYRLTESTTTSNPVRDVIYSYDAASNIVSMIDPAGVYTKAYGYDALNRLITDDNEKGLYTYQYDANGNRTQLSVTDANNTTTVLTTSYTTGTNRIATSGGSPVTYDGSGNVVGQNGFQSFSYNNANRLVGNSFNFGGQNLPLGTYTYNALGRRVTFDDDVQFLYTPDGKYLVKASWGSGSVPFERTEYIYLDDIPVAQVHESLNSNGTVASTALTYIHSDHLNTPRLMTNGAKDVIWRWEGDAFGQGTPAQTGTNGEYDFLDLRFPGQISDNGNTSYYNINRYYDPLLGRYTQSDPIGLLGGLNTYAYVGGNPISHIDPLGLWSFSGAAFDGWGGAVIFGNDDCGRFFTIRIGVGAGGGFSFDPGGVRPGGDEDCGCKNGSGPASGGISGGVYGEVSGALPWISASLGVEGGARDNNDGSGSFYGGPTSGISLPGSGGGIEADASAGAEFSFYGAKH